MVEIHIVTAVKLVSHKSIGIKYDEWLEKIEKNVAYNFFYLFQQNIYIITLESIDELILICECVFFFSLFVCFCFLFLSLLLYSTSLSSSLPIGEIHTSFSPYYKWSTGQRRENQSSPFVVLIPSTFAKTS